MKLSFQENVITINDLRVEVSWPVLDAVKFGRSVFVLIDPNVYLKDPSYQDSLRRGAPAIRNLIAFRDDGTKMWEAEFPESADYYYKIVCLSPLTVNSFSSYRCEIDPENGQIRRREFLK